MTTTSHLPHLLKLLDDDSPVVQEALAREFMILDSELDGALAELVPEMSPGHRIRIAELREEGRRLGLKAAWPDWLRHRGDKQRLEEAQRLLAEYLDPEHRPGRLGDLLDELAAECRERVAYPDSYRLARFLFQEKGFEGSRTDYYHPSNSNLVHVIEHREGIPISLACVYMLVGERLGIEIDGCNFPGHFLARATLGGQVVLVDCFNGGRFIEADSIRDLSDDAESSVDRYVTVKASAATIVERVLNNLMKAFNIVGDDVNSRFMKELLALLQRDT